MCMRPNRTTGDAASCILRGVKLYALSSRWDDEPIRLFETCDEAEDVLLQVGGDKLGLSAEAFVTEIDFDFERRPPPGPGARPGLAAWPEESLGERGGPS